MNIIRYECTTRFNTRLYLYVHTSIIIRHIEYPVSISNRFQSITVLRWIMYDVYNNYNTQTIASVYTTQRSMTNLAIWEYTIVLCVYITIYMQVLYWHQSTYLELGIAEIQGHFIISALIYSYAYKRVKIRYVCIDYTNTIYSYTLVYMICNNTHVYLYIRSREKLASAEQQ